MKSPSINMMALIACATSGEARRSDLAKELKKGLSIKSKVAAKKTNDPLENQSEGARSLKSRGWDSSCGGGGCKNLCDIYAPYAPSTNDCCDPKNYCCEDGQGDIINPDDGSTSGQGYNNKCLSDDGDTKCYSEDKCENPDCCDAPWGDQYYTDSAYWERHPECCSRDSSWTKGPTPAPTPTPVIDHCVGLSMEKCKSYRAKKYFACKIVDKNTEQQQCVGSKKGVFEFEGKFEKLGVFSKGQQEVGDCTGPCCGLPKFVCKGKGGVLSRAWEKMFNQGEPIKQACKFERVGMFELCLPRSAANEN